MRIRDPRRKDPETVAEIAKAQEIGAAIVELMEDAPRPDELDLLLRDMNAPARPFRSDA